MRIEGNYNAAPLDPNLEVERWSKGSFGSTRHQTSTMNDADRVMREDMAVHELDAIAPSNVSQDQRVRQTTMAGTSDKESMWEL